DQADANGDGKGDACEEEGRPVITPPILCGPDSEMKQMSEKQIKDLHLTVKDILRMQAGYPLEKNGVTFLMNGREVKDTVQCVKANALLRFSGSKVGCGLRRP
ncbi:MAG: hypothetical protein Q7T11_05165, partial [Deltaproteobacteria bacterium]|nr:hypothetical protein [Deltaproteobacteria bacterium]